MAGFIRQFPGPRVVIDHHVSEDDLGATVFKDSTAEATGHPRHEGDRRAGVLVTRRRSPTGLLTAIAMDTGWFRHSNTRAGTLRAVAELIDAGAGIDDIYRKLFERNTLGRLKLMGETLVGHANRPGWENRLRHDFARDDLLRTGAIPPDSEDLIDYTVSLRGVEVGMLFIEQVRGGVKVRSGLAMAWTARGWPPSSAAADIEQAAGATVPGPMSEIVERVLQAVRRALDSESSLDLETPLRSDPDDSLCGHAPGRSLGESHPSLSRSNVRDRSLARTIDGRPFRARISRITRLYWNRLGRVPALILPRSRPTIHPAAER